MARKPRAETFDVEALRKSLEAGAPAPVHVLSGEDDFFRNDALRLLKANILEGLDPAVSLTEYEEPPSPAELFDGLRSPGLFAPRRMVILDPADAFASKNADALKDYAKSPAEEAFLVLVAAKWAPDAALKKAAGANLVAVSCAPLHPRAVPPWLAMRARAYGKRLNSGVAQLMTETAGTNLAVLDRHLQNLATYAGDRADLAAEDVANLVGGDPQRATWELTSAVVAGKPDKALRLLQQMFRRGAVALMVISALANEFSRLWRVKRMLRDGASDEEMLAAIGKHLRFRLVHIKREANAIPPARLLNAQKALLQFDMACKTSAMPDELLLETLVVKLCSGQ